MGQWRGAGSRLFTPPSGRRVHGVIPAQYVQAPQREIPLARLRPPHRLGLHLARLPKGNAGSKAGVFHASGTASKSRRATPRGQCRQGAAPARTAARGALPKQPALTPWGAVGGARAGPPLPRLLRVLNAAVEAKASAARSVPHKRAPVGLFNHLAAAGACPPRLRRRQRAEGGRAVLVRRRRLRNEASGLLMPRHRTPDAGVGTAQGALHLVIGVVAVFSRRRTDGRGRTACLHSRRGILVSVAIIVQGVSGVSHAGRARTTGATGTASRSPSGTALPTSSQLKIKRYSACRVCTVCHSPHARGLDVERLKG